MTQAAPITQATIATIPGDGVGPEVVEQAVMLLETVAGLHGLEFQFPRALLGGAAIDVTGTPLPEETLALCQRSDAILFGAVGGPKWSDPQAPVRPEQGLLDLRKALGLFANLRPVRVDPALVDASTLKPEVLSGVDLVIVRELTGGLYFGPRGRRQRSDGQEETFDTLVYTPAEIERVAHVAFRLARSRAPSCGAEAGLARSGAPSCGAEAGLARSGAPSCGAEAGLARSGAPSCRAEAGLARGRRKLLTSVDKANVLESSRLWRRVVNDVARQYPDVTLEHLLVDACAMRLVRDPRHFDVIVTENMFGDILSDEAAQLAGSMGMLPSASLGARRLGLYEPIHGSAPDIAGKGVANPIAAILSGALLLRHSLGLPEEAAQIERAVSAVLARGYRTPDLVSPKGGETAQGFGPVVGTAEMGRLVAEEVVSSHKG